MSSLSAAAASMRKLPFAHVRQLGQLFDDMRKRCSNPASKSWPSYGGRGIRVCAEWLEDRHAFYAWALGHGYEPGLTIERDEVNGNYEPGNCRFIPRPEQANNTRRNQIIEWNGERLNRTQWERRLGLPAGILFKRQSRGWPVGRMLTEPAHGAAA